MHVRRGVSHGRAGRCVAGLKLRRRFGRSITVEVRHPQSGLVLHTGKPHLQGAYIGMRLWLTLSDEDMLFLSEGGICFFFFTYHCHRSLSTG